MVPFPVPNSEYLGWSQAQFVRLAWDIEQSRLAEQPSVVTCRYVGCP